MKILQINTVCGVGSTGKIAADIHKYAEGNGHSGKIAFRGGEIGDVPAEDTIRIGTTVDYYFHVLMTRLTGKTGFYSKKATARFIKEIEIYDPDIVHIHILHGYYINIEILFDYLKEKNKNVVFTQHCCWAFTGHCPYFTFINCNKWKTGCYVCPLIHEYPKSAYLDSSKWNYEHKRRIFTQVDKAVIATPSDWLASLVEESFLKKFNVVPVYNGIDLDKFKPVDSKFREKHNLKDKFIILGVAPDWKDERKGLSDFLKMAKMLDEFEVIVLVGDMKDNTSLPDNIVHVARTNSIGELAEVYTAADVFVNPSRQETFGLTIVESLACGTPSIVYDATAMPELIDETCGVAVEKQNVTALLEAARDVKNSNAITKDNCLKRAKIYSKENMCKGYMEIYEKMLNESA